MAARRALTSAISSTNGNLFSRASMRADTSLKRESNFRSIAESRDPTASSYASSPSRRASTTFSRSPTSSFRVDLILTSNEGSKTLSTHPGTRSTNLSAPAIAIVGAESI